MNKFTSPVFVVFAVVAGAYAETLLGVRAAYGPHNNVWDWAVSVDGAETSCYMFDGTNWSIYMSEKNVFQSITPMEVPQCAFTHPQVGRMMFA